MGYIRNGYNKITNSDSLECHQIFMSIKATVATKLACLAYILLFIKVLLLIAITVTISHLKCINKVTESVNTVKVIIPKSSLIRTPWMLSLGDSSADTRKIVCGAVVISVKWALSTAYCVQFVFNISKGEFYKTSLILSENSIYHLFSDVITHEKYAPMSFSNNIAVIKVMPYFDDLHEIPIQLEQHSQKTKLNIFGWLKDSDDKNLVKVGLTDLVYCRLNKSEQDSFCVRARTIVYPVFLMLPGAALVHDNFILGLSHIDIVFEFGVVQGEFVNLSYWSSWIQNQICADILKANL